MFVDTKELEAYQIGENIFFIDENDGFLREIRTGRIVTDEEWESFEEYKEKEYEQKKKEEEFERRMQEAERRYKLEKNRIRREIFS